MAKKKSGLHKKISAIFDGVPIPTSPMQGNADPASPDNGRVAPKQDPTPSAPKPYVPPEPKPVDRTKPAAPPKKQVKPAPKPVYKSRQPAGFSAKKEEDKQTVKIAIVVILALVMGWKIYRIISPPSSGQAENPVIQNDGTGVNTAIKWPLYDPYPKETRDPMVDNKEIEEPPIEPPLNRHGLVLMGISMHEDAGKSFAIIKTITNTIISTSEVAEGEMINGVNILKIHRDRVTIEKDGETEDLRY